MNQGGYEGMDERENKNQPLILRTPAPKFANKNRAELNIVDLPCLKGVYEISKTWQYNTEHLELICRKYIFEIHSFCKKTPPPKFEPRPPS